jgi:hypothetical protein
VTRLEVVITGDAKNLISNLKQAGASVKEFSGEGEKASKSNQMFGGSLKSVAAEFGPMLGIAAVTTAMGAYAKQSIEAAMSNERLGRANEAMAKTIGESSASIVESIQESSNFTISRQDAMLASNKAMLFGLVQNKEQMAELTKIAITLGAAMGQDATKSLDDLTTALGRQSPLILDNLGITLKLEDAHRIYADSLGKTVEQLTAEEKQQAFVNAALQIGREKVEELGGVTLDTAGKMERLSARWEDMQSSSGEAILALEDALGVLDKLNSVMDYAIGNVEAMAAGFDQGLVPGMLQLFDNANPVTQLLEKMGVDVIPDFVEASDEATDAIAKQGEAHTATTEEIAAQEEAVMNLAKTQMEALTDLGKLEEDYNEKKTKLLDDRLEAENEAANATVENSQTLNEKLRENEQERADKIKEIHERAAQDEDKTNGAKYQRDIEKANEHFNKKGEKIRESYTEENAQIRDKLDERLQEIKEKLAEEEKLYKERAEEMKRLMAAQALEQSGKLEELTGIAGITAQQYVEAVKYGAIQANKEVETEMASIEKSFQGAQRNTSKLVEENQRIIARAHGESLNSIEGAHARQTQNAISNWERQRQAAEKAVPPLFKPGSPTPFEIGLRGIADAADSVSGSMEKMGGSIIGAAANAEQLDKAMEATKSWWGTAAGKAYAKKVGVGKNKGDQASSDLMNYSQIAAADKAEAEERRRLAAFQEQFRKLGYAVPTSLYPDSQSGPGPASITNNRTFNYSPTYNGVNSSNPEMDYYLMNSLAG